MRGARRRRIDFRARIRQRRISRMIRLYRKIWRGTRDFRGTCCRGWDVGKAGFRRMVLHAPPPDRWAEIATIAAVAYIPSPERSVNGGLPNRREEHEMVWPRARSVSEKRISWRGNENGLRHAIGMETQPSAPQTRAPSETSIRRWLVVERFAFKSPRSARREPRSPASTAPPCAPRRPPPPGSG